jgi:hypothetical protein
VAVFCSGFLSLSNLSLLHILELALRDLCGRNRRSSCCCVLSGDYSGVGAFAANSDFLLSISLLLPHPFMYSPTTPKPLDLGFSLLSPFSDILPHNAMPISWSCFSTQRALGLRLVSFRIGLSIHELCTSIYVSPVFEWFVHVFVHAWRS